MHEEKFHSMFRNDCCKQMNVEPKNYKPNATIENNKYYLINNQNRRGRQTNKNLCVKESKILFDLFISKVKSVTLSLTATMLIDKSNSEKLTSQSHLNSSKIVPHAGTGHGTWNVAHEKKKTGVNF